MFKDKTLIITGGTGSFGTAVLKRFYDTDLKEIRIFSRDEKKQDDLRRKFNNPKIKWIIGDVRDKRSVDTAMRDVDYVFHAAALKQVPSCEFFPMQAVRTNIMGAENVLDSAIENRVERVVVLSTDKAVRPINAMGMTKALMEKVMIAKSRHSTHTMLCGTRYGNVMASRGSVIPLFVNQIKQGKPLTITDPSMTRFMMTLEHAVDLVLYAFENGNQGDIFVQKAPAATIETLANTLKEMYNASNEIKMIGTRHGEKLYESLVNVEEMIKAEDMGDYYRIPADTRDLNYSSYFSEGELDVSKIEEYNSHNTYRLNNKELKEILLQLDLIKKDL
jgi:UDP-glucose 4-epimerase